MTQGGVKTKKISRPGSKTPQNPPYGPPLVMTRNEFHETLMDRAEAEAQRVYELDEPHGDYYIPDQDEFIPHPEQDEDGDAHVGGAIDTFANTGVGIGDWRDMQDMPTKSERVHKHTLPLLGNWSNKRAQVDNYPLYSHQPKFDKMAY